MVAYPVLVFGLRRKHPDVWRHPKIANRHHVIQLPDNPDVLWHDSYLFKGLAKGGGFKTIVGVVAGAARKRYLAFVVLHVSCAFGEDNVRFTVAVTNKYEYRCWGRLRVLYMTRRVFRDGVQDAIRSIFGNHSRNRNE